MLQLGSRRSVFEGYNSMPFGAAVIFAFCLMSALLELSGPASAKRVALVIGNDIYDRVRKLEKAVNDADAMAATLREIGFKVLQTNDSSRQAMNRSIERFTSELENGDEALFFYAGHGVEIGGRNYLLPTDIPTARLGQENYVIAEAIAVDAIMRRIRSRRPRVSIMILDACRDNPFPRSNTRSLGGTRGLAKSVAPEGTFIMFSAGVGQLALDRLPGEDPHPNSVFTRSLIPLIKRPGLSLVATARQVRKQVEKIAKKVKHEQRPAYYDEVTGDFFFVPPKPKITNKPPFSKSALPAREANSEEQAWIAIKDLLSSIPVLEAFIAEFPNGIYAKFARVRIAELHAAKNAVQQRTKLANLTPPDAQIAGAKNPALPPPKINLDIDQADLVQQTQIELNRLGCDVGDPDGKWGKRSRGGMRNLARHMGLRLASLDPTQALLRKLRSEAGRVCPLTCPRGKQLRNGRCAPVACKAGQKRSSKGKCYYPSKKTQKKCPTGQRRSSRGNCYTPKAVQPTIRRAISNPTRTRPRKKDANVRAFPVGAACSMNPPCRRDK